MGKIIGLLYALIAVPALAADRVEVGEADHLLVSSFLSLARGDLEAARDAAARSEQLAEAHGNSLGVFKAAASLAQIEEASGQINRATKRLLRLRVSCRESGDTKAELNCLHQLAEFAVRQGALDEAIVFYENAKILARGRGHREFVATCKLLGDTYELIGDYDSATRETKAALAGCVGDEAAALKGQLLVARALSDSSPDAVTPIQEYLQTPALSDYVRGRLSIALGQRLLAMGRIDESLSAFEFGLAILPNRNLEATRRGSFDYARALARSTRPKDARNVLRKLEESLPRHSELLAEVKLLQAQLLGEPDLAQHALALLRQQRIVRATRQTDFRRALAEHRNHIRETQEQERLALVKKTADFRTRCWAVGSMAFALAVFTFGLMHLRSQKRIAAMESRVEYERAIERQDRFQAIGTLTSGVAHDFNNIMTIVQSITDTICRFSGHKLSAEELEMLDLVLKATDSGTEITRQLVALSRGSEEENECFRPEKQTQEVARLLRRTLGEQIDLKVISNAPAAVIRGSKAQFSTALINLCTNSRDAIADAGTIAIKVQELSLSGRECVQISVQDDGCGMAEIEALKASMALYSTKPSGEGSGLGLAMVERFVTQCGGTLNISSSPGRGTTISMRLPPAATPQAPPNLRGLHALCVDDCASVLSSVTTTLDKLGCVVQTAFDPEEATNILDSASRFDVILIASSACRFEDDRDFLALLERTIPTVPIVLMTHELTGRTGVTHLCQPFNEIELAQAINSAVVSLPVHR